MERQIINPWVWQDAYGFVQANEVSDTQRVLYCAGQVSVDEGNPLHPGDMSAQIAQSLDNLETVLDNAGFEMSDVVRLNFYTTDVDSTLEAWSSQIKDRLAQSGCRQVSTLLGVAGLYHPDILIEIEATAVA